MIRNFIRNFMAGRYGPDHLGVLMILLSLVLNLINSIVRFPPLMWISYVLLFLTLFRMLSKNIVRRRAENDKFIKYWWPIKTKIRRAFSNIKQRKMHKFFKCPGCRKTLRVPKGKGKLQVTCPKCGERFFKKT